MPNLNPMAINGPGWAGNYVQPNTALPTVSSAVASYTVGSNVMSLTWPIPRYVDPVSAKDDPQGTIRGHL